MAADTTSIFYQIGQATKQRIADDITALKAANNTWTGTNDFQNNVTVGTTTQARNFKVYGVAETTSDLTVGGNLTVNGTTTTLSTSTLEVEDNFVHLSKGASAGSYNNDSGLYFERGTGEDATAFIWDESEDKFVLGSLASVASSAETTTFASLPAQIATTTSGATVGVSISGALGYSSTSQYGANGTVNDPGKFYVITGDISQVTVQTGSDSVSYLNDIGSMGSGYYIIIGMGGDGNYSSDYAIIGYLATGDTWADATKVHLYDSAAGAFFNDQGEMYTPSSFANGNTFDFSSGEGSSLTHTNGYPTTGTGIFTFSVSDTTASLGTNDDTTFTTGAYPRTASIASSGSVSFSVGSFDVTFTIKGQLATDIDTFQITEQAGGSTQQGGNALVSPFVFSGTTLTYYLDSSSQSANTFTKLTSDVANLDYSSSYTNNGGYYVGGGGNAVLEVSYSRGSNGSTPGAPSSSDYIDIPSTVTQSTTQAPSVTTGPTDATANVTPGALGVGTLSLVDQTDGQLNLGDLTDFEAGLA